MTADTMLPSPFYQRLRLDVLKRVRPGTAVFVTATLLRLLVLFRSADTPHFLPLDGDMKFYSDWALRIAHGQWTDHQAFYGLPGYAYLLAGLYSLIGVQPYIALLLQVLVESITTLLIFRLAPLSFALGANASSETHTLGDGRTLLIGWVATLGWMFFVPAQAYCTILMPTTYFVAAFWFVVWWTLRERAQLPRAREFFFIGFFMGCVSMMVANILFLTGFITAALLFKQSWIVSPTAGANARWRTSTPAGLLLLVGIGLGASPCWMHNYFVAREPVLLSAHSGINFWIGNNPQANGYPKIPDGMHANQEGLLKDSITFAEEAVGHPLKRFEVSAYWSDKAHRYITDHPDAFMRLLGVKLGNFWNGYQYDDLGIILPMQEDGVLLPGIGFGLVAGLGIPGLLLAAARRPRARWLVAAVLLHMLSLLSVFVTERYRMAAVPGLLLLASFGVVEFAALLTNRRWVPLATYAVLLLGSFLVAQRPLPDSGLLYLDDYNTGITDLANQHMERARPKLERVYNNNPNNAEAAFAMGNLALAESNNATAMVFYQRTLQLDSQHTRAMNNLAVLAMEQGQREAARSLFSQALQITPQDAKMEYLLANVCVSLHDLPGARDAIEAAIRLAPDRRDYQLLRSQVNQQSVPGNL